MACAHILARLINNILVVHPKVAMLSCKNVAEYFLSLADEDAGDLISNLKLQKLVYYAQGFYLALYNRPLFEEDIEAWTHGPVVPALYHEYKSHAANAIPQPTGINFNIYSDEVKELLDDVYAVMGQFSAWKLRNMTQEEAPWKEAQGEADHIITREAMRDFFKTRLTPCHADF